MTFLGRFSAVLLILSSFISNSWAEGWSNELLNLTGTSLIFDEATVQQQLHKPQRPDFNELLSSSNFKAWAGARLWIVQKNQNQIQNYELKPYLNTEANQRGIILFNQLNKTDIPLLTQAINQYQTQPQLLRELLNKQQTDGLVVISSQAQEIQWQIFGASSSVQGKISNEGLIYLPHIWAENLAMSWQWPELNNGILFRIDNISQLEQFIDAENALQTACSQLRILQVVGTQADFACLSTQSYTYLVNQLRLIPQLAHVPFIHQALAPNVLIGQQLTQRYLHYQWLTDAY
ncbi:MAG: hypothetical protein IPM78_06505 [Moraxellaceae bacterium]|nr:hypothetical protein [Moraxellaceae bacterium]